MQKTIIKVCVCTIIFILAGLCKAFITQFLIWLPINYFEEFFALGGVIFVFFICLFIQKKYWIFKGSNRVKMLKKVLLLFYGIIVTSIVYWSYIILSFWLSMRSY